MANLKAIRKRIASVKATEKITRAMKMVAGARLNRAQQRILALRPYALKTGEIVRSVAASMTPEGEGGAVSGDGTQRVVPGDGAHLIADEKSGPAHPLLERRPEQNLLFLVLSGDRGLCG